MAEHPDDRGPERDSRAVGDWYRLTGLGIEFIAAVLVGLSLGYLADRGLGTDPWFFLIGGGVGFGAGLWLLLKAAKKVFRD